MSESSDRRYAKLNPTGRLILCDNCETRLARVEVRRGGFRFGVFPASWVADARGQRWTLRPREADKEGPAHATAARNVVRRVGNQGERLARANLARLAGSEGLARLLEGSPEALQAQAIRVLPTVAHCPNCDEAQILEAGRLRITPVTR